MRLFKNCRRAMIVRKETVTKEVNSKIEEKIVTREFPVYVNSAVTDDHKMLR